MGSISAYAAPPPLEGLPRYSHVIVLIEENESIGATFAPNSPAVYLNKLAKRGAFADHYYAIGHESLDNYIGMLNGQPDNPHTGSDCIAVSLYVCAQPQATTRGGRNLADQLESVGASWQGYMDGTTAPCQHGPYSQSSVAPDPYQGNGGTPPPAGKNYADRHNPFLYFPDIIGDTNRCQRHVVPFTNLADDIANKKVPQFVFITPDTCHDGHDNPCSGGAPGGLVSLDAWLSKHGPALVKYVYSHNSLLLITFDEGSNTDASGCCTGGPGGSAGVGGRVGLVALGPHVKGGQTVSTKYDHVSMLRAIEDLFGISDHLGNASTASPMSDIFAP